MCVYPALGGYAVATHTGARRYNRHAPSGWFRRLRRSLELAGRNGSGALMRDFPRAVQNFRVYAVLSKNSDGAIWRVATRLNGAGCLRGRYTRRAMSPLRLPFHLILLTFAGWVNRHQLDVIEYLQEENRLLKERLGGRRPRFTDAERRRLARKAHTLGRKALKDLD